MELPLAVWNGLKFKFQEFWYIIITLIYNNLCYG